MVQPTRTQSSRRCPFHEAHGVVFRSLHASTPAPGTTHPRRYPHHPVSVEPVVASPGRKSGIGRHAREFTSQSLGNDPFHFTVTHDLILDGAEACFKVPVLLVLPREHAITAATKPRHQMHQPKCTQRNKTTAIGPSSSSCLPDVFRATSCALEIFHTCRGSPDLVHRCLRWNSTNTRTLRGESYDKPQRQRPKVLHAAT